MITQYHNSYASVPLPERFSLNVLYYNNNSIRRLLRRCNQFAFQSSVRIQSFCLRVFALAPSAMRLQ